MPSETARFIDPGAVALPAGYRLEALARGLAAPRGLAFGDGGSLYAAVSGPDGGGRVARLDGGGCEIVAEGLSPPLYGITFYDGGLYVAHKSRVTLVTLNGAKKELLRGLPSFGDHGNSRVAFSPEGRLYFGQGTATNSGVVGPDNAWLAEHPYFHDSPGADIRLRGANYASGSLLSPASGEGALTGAFVPYGRATVRGEVVRGSVRASGGILSCKPDGSGLELEAWGLRAPRALRFDCSGRLLALNLGMEERGSRPVANAADELVVVRRGLWYGWPDYSGGLPVSMPRFAPAGGAAPRLLILDPPMAPPKPLALLPRGSAAAGFAVCRGPSFSYGDAYLAEGGSARISRFDTLRRSLSVFARNVGPGGFGRLSDLVFGEDGAMYLSDLGVEDGSGRLVANTGVIWRISRACKYVKATYSSASRASGAR